MRMILHKKTFRGYFCYVVQLVRYLDPLLGMMIGQIINDRTQYPRGSMVTLPKDKEGEVRVLHILIYGHNLQVVAFASL